METKIKKVLVENNWTKSSEFFVFKHGWGNGYVGVPKDHPWYGKHYDEIEAYVHGGLTFSENGLFGEQSNIWFVGFDTSHCSDTKENCPLSFVAEQTDNLYKQAVDAYRNEK